MAEIKQTPSMPSRALIGVMLTGQRWSPRLRSSRLAALKSGSPVCHCGRKPRLIFL